MKERRELVFITDSFPYGSGEGFAVQELQQLSREYRVSVVPRFVGQGDARALPEGVRLCNVARPMTAMEKIRHTLGFFLSPVGRREWMAILSGGEKRRIRWKESLRHYVAAEHFWAELKENALVNPASEQIFYSFWYSPAALGLSLHRREMPCGRVVVRIHGYDLYNERTLGGRQPFKPAADEGIDRVVFCCDYGKQYYLRSFGAGDSSEYAVIPLGSRTPEGMCWQEKGKALSLLSCSGAVPVKRLERVIEGLAALPGVRVDWTHVGGGPLLETLRAQAQEMLGGKDHISWHFTGHVDHEQVHRIFSERSWDCFINVSASEGSPISIQEALSYGIPVVATAVGGSPELLENTGNRLLTENPDGPEIANALCAMDALTDEQRTALRKANRRRWEERYCAEVNSQRLSRMMEELYE